MNKFIRVVLIIFLFLIALHSCSKQDITEPSLTIHYYRYDGDYEGWNVWAWPYDPPGEAGIFLFGNPDAQGFVTADVFLKSENEIPIKEIGMIIRKSENGNDWAEKDGNNDRFTGEKEIWLMQNDSAVYTQKPAVKNPPIVFAAADSKDSVIITLPKEPDDYAVFAVYKDGEKLDGSSRKSDEGLEKKCIIALDAPIDPAALYTVNDESGVFSERAVTMRKILDDYYYGGDDLGLQYSAAGSSFKVWAPTATKVSLALYGDAGEYNSAGRVPLHETENLYPMEKDFAAGVWAASLPGDLEGKFYLYRAEFADGITTYAADPYAKAVSANGQRMAIVDLKKNNPQGWKPSEKPPFNAGAWQDAVIYELHVRDFSIDENSGMMHKGKYLAFTERGTKTRDGVPTGIDHLIQLGITHVHLLPVFDFASINEMVCNETADDCPDGVCSLDAPPEKNPSTEAQYNWGYDPMHYNVLEGSYSSNAKDPNVRIIEFKAMVQALHDAGIRVVMDVVFNHTFITGSFPFDAIVPGYYYRTTDTGAYSNGSGCGNEVASERPMVRKFIIDSCRYWASEYNIDGFRFDLMGLIDIPTMAQLTEELRRGIDPSLIIYGEPWTAGGSSLTEELQTIIGAQKGLGFAVFNDRFRNAIKGGSDDSSPGFASGKPEMEKDLVHGIQGHINDFTAEANESINYVTAHDNLNLWDKMALASGAKDMANAPYSLLDGTMDIFDSDAVKSSLLANGIVFTSQGIPFFQAGDEFLRSKFGDHNSYQSPDAVNKIRWENAARYREITNYYAGLIRLRKAHPAFRLSKKADIEESLEMLSAEDSSVSFMLKGKSSGDSWQTIFVAYNGSRADKTFTLPASAPAWNQAVDARRAGTETLAVFTGTVTLPPLSMTVMYNGTAE